MMYLLRKRGMRRAEPPEVRVYHKSTVPLGELLGLYLELYQRTLIIRVYSSLNIEMHAFASYVE